MLGSGVRVRFPMSGHFLIEIFLLWSYLVLTQIIFVKNIFRFKYFWGLEIFGVQIFEGVKNFGS